MKSLKISTTILLVSAIVILVNVLSENYNLRLDFTENHQYTLSKATPEYPCKPAGACNGNRLFFKGPAPECRKRLEGIQGHAD